MESQWSKAKTNCYRPGTHWTSISNALAVSPSIFYSPSLALLCFSQGLSGLDSSEASGLLTTLISAPLSKLKRRNESVRWTRICKRRRWWLKYFFLYLWMPRDCYFSHCTHHCSPDTRTDCCHTPDWKGDLRGSKQNRNLRDGKKLQCRWVSRELRK